ncbi:MAG TPA: NlpC/P60 family protein [Pseudonocardiaceae bacterium]|jgi:cell wall-associated NlpC family hydrolase|nr:NlpC/P60 family protein [Pseudonocardiaceae bacterium]
MTTTAAKAPKQVSATNPVVSLFADPIRARLRELADHAELAEHAKTDLNGAASTLTDQHNRLHTEQKALTAHWQGTAAASFSSHSTIVTAQLNTTAQALSGADTVLTGALGELRTQHTAVARLVEEYTSQGNQLMSAATSLAGAGHPTAMIDAVNHLSALSRQYVTEADTAVRGARTALTTATKDLGELEDQLPTPKRVTTPAKQTTTKTKTPPKHKTTHSSSTHTSSSDTVNVGHGLGTVTAPNPRAATAVRAALTQLGVPYVWAGETPGKGFDCSGLTSWAYGKAGISLPHYASSQRIGEQVSEKDLKPGDLVIFSGHVTMYVGKGHVIAAPYTGTDVQIQPLFTSISGDPFLGFWRPSVR